MGRVWKLFVTSASTAMLSCLCHGETTHDIAVQGFSQPTTIICCEDTLMNYLKKVKSGTGMIVFERHVKTDHADIPICRFELKNGQVIDPVELITTDCTSTIDGSLFLSCCKEPALLQYKKKVYLNIPNMTVKLSDGKTISDLLCPQLSAALQALPIATPNTKLRCAISIPGIGNQIQLGVYQIADTLNRQVVAEAACDYIEKKAYGEWKKKHETMVKSLPRRAPVAYGDVKTITRTMLGTYIIPREAPPSERTITRTETVWADAHGWGTTDSGEGVDVDMRVPIGERTITRTKKVSSAMNYEKLKKQLEEYEALVRAIEDDKPPTVNTQAVANAISSKDCKLTFSICK